MDDAFLDKLLEELAAFDNRKEETVRMRCERCGYEEDVPEWVYGEFADEDRYLGHDTRETGIDCPHCGRGVMHIKR